MRNLTSIALGTACAASAAFFGSNAAAHIELLDPPPRYELPANKSCPCGDGDSNRTCNDTAAESTDPNRSTTNVTTFEAGATIIIHAEEYIDHAGRMRVAFDPDGADFADFNDNVLIDLADPADPSITQANPRGWDFEVTLPTEPCESCTLQVVQVMNVPTDVPYPDPATASTYYTCADIRIVPAGTLGQDPGVGGSGGAGSSNGGSANVDSAGSGGSAVAEGGAAGAAGAAGAGSSSAGGPATAGRGGSSSTGSAGTGAVSDAGDDSSDDGGCAIQPGSEHRSAAWLVAGIAGAAMALLRRRRA